MPQSILVSQKELYVTFLSVYAGVLFQASLGAWQALNTAHHRASLHLTKVLQPDCAVKSLYDVCNNNSFSIFHGHAFSVNCSDNSKQNSVITPAQSLSVQFSLLFLHRSGHCSVMETKAVMGRQQLSFKPWLYLAFFWPRYSMCLCVVGYLLELSNTYCQLKRSMNGQRSWRCAASGSSALCQWSGYSPDRLSQMWSRPLLSQLTRVGVFPFVLSLLLLLTLFQH